MQQGSSMDRFREEVKSYAMPIEKQAEQAAASKEPRKIKDVSDAWQNASIEQKIALGGSLLSFAPGPVGAVGGLITTVAEAKEDLKDGLDWGDAGNFALNLGFTGLSLVGLGGARALKIGAKGAKGAKAAAKAAKAADAAVDTSKTARRISKIAGSGARYGKEAQIAGKRADTVLDSIKTVYGTKTSKAAGEILSSTKVLDPRVLDAAKKAGYTIDNVTDGAGLAKVMSKDLAIINKAGAAPSTWLGHYGKHVGDGIASTWSRGIQNAPQMLVRGSQAATIGQGAVGAFNLGVNIKDEGSFIGGLQTTDMRDLRRIGQLGAMGMFTYKNALNKKSYLQNTTESGRVEAKYGIKVGDKKYAAKAEIDNPDKFTWKGVYDKTKMQTLSKEAKDKAKDAAKETLAQNLRTELKKTLVDTSDETVNAIIKEVLDNKAKIRMDKSAFRGAIEGARTLNEGPRSYSYKDISRFRRAQNIVYSGTANYGSADRLK